MADQQQIPVSIGVPPSACHLGKGPAALLLDAWAMGVERESGSDAEVGQKAQEVEMMVLLEL